MVYSFPIGKIIIMDEAKRFGDMIATARKGLGLTQRDLALAIGTGERFIVDLERGKPTAQLGKALAAARAVGLRLLDPPSGAHTPYERQG